MIEPLDFYYCASRFAGIKEMPGPESNPIVLAMLQLDSPWVKQDEVAWCSAFVNFVAFFLGLPRSKKLNARSWLDVGTQIPLTEARRGDIVILSRGDNPVEGHVGIFVKLDGLHVDILGGNQSNQVTIARFPVSRVLGTRRIVEENQNGK